MSSYRGLELHIYKFRGNVKMLISTNNFKLHLFLGFPCTHISSCPIQQPQPHFSDHPHVAASESLAKKASTSFFSICSFTAGGHTWFSMYFWLIRNWFVERRTRGRPSSSFNLFNLPWTLLERFFKVGRAIMSASPDADKPTSLSLRSEWLR